MQLYLNLGLPSAMIVDGNVANAINMGWNVLDSKDGCILGMLNLRISRLVVEEYIVV